MSKLAFLLLSQQLDRLTATQVVPQTPPASGRPDVGAFVPAASVGRSYSTEPIGTSPTSSSSSASVFRPKAAARFLSNGAESKTSCGAAAGAVPAGPPRLQLLPDADAFAPRRLMINPTATWRGDDSELEKLHNRPRLSEEKRDWLPDGSMRERSDLSPSRGPCGSASPQQAQRRRRENRQYGCSAGAASISSTHERDGTTFHPTIPRGMRLSLCQRNRIRGGSQAGDENGAALNTPSRSPPTPKHRGIFAGAAASPGADVEKPAPAPPLVLTAPAGVPVACPIPTWWSYAGGAPLDMPAGAPTMQQAAGFIDGQQEPVLPMMTPLQPQLHLQQQYQLLQLQFQQLQQCKWNWWSSMEQQQAANGGMPIGAGGDLFASCASPASNGATPTCTPGPDRLQHRDEDQQQRPPPNAGPGGTPPTRKPDGYAIFPCHGGVATSPCVGFMIPEQDSSGANKYEATPATPPAPTPQSTSGSSSSTLGHGYSTNSTLASPPLLPSTFPASASWPTPCSLWPNAAWACATPSSPASCCGVGRLGADVCASPAGGSTSTIMPLGASAASAASPGQAQPCKSEQQSHPTTFMPLQPAARNRNVAASSLATSVPASSCSGSIDERSPCCADSPPAKRRVDVDSPTTSFLARQTTDEGDHDGDDAMTASASPASPAGSENCTIVGSCASPLSSFTLPPAEVEDLGPTPGALDIVMTGFNGSREDDIAFLPETDARAQESQHGCSLQDAVGRGGAAPPLQHLLGRGRGRAGRVRSSVAAATATTPLLASTAGTKKDGSNHDVSCRSGATHVASENPSTPTPSAAAASCRPAAASRAEGENMDAFEVEAEKVRARIMAEREKSGINSNAAWAKAYAAADRKRLQRTGKLGKLQGGKPFSQVLQRIKDGKPMLASDFSSNGSDKTCSNSGYAGVDVGRDSANASDETSSGVAAPDMIEEGARPRAEALIQGQGVPPPLPFSLEALAPAALSPTQYDVPPWAISSYCAGTELPTMVPVTMSPEQQACFFACLQQLQQKQQHSIDHFWQRQIPIREEQDEEHVDHAGGPANHEATESCQLASTGADAGDLDAAHVPMEMSKSKKRREKRKQARQNSDGDTARSYPINAWQMNRGVRAYDSEKPLTVQDFASDLHQLPLLIPGQDAHIQGAVAFITRGKVTDSRSEWLFAGEEFQRLGAKYKPHLEDKQGWIDFKRRYFLKGRPTRDPTLMLALPPISDYLHLISPNEPGGGTPSPGPCSRILRTTPGAFMFMNMGHLLTTPAARPTVFRYLIEFSDDLPDFIAREQEGVGVVFGHRGVALQQFTQKIGHNMATKSGHTWHRNQRDKVKPPPSITLNRFGDLYIQSKHLEQAQGPAWVDPLFWHESSQRERWEKIAKEAEKARVERIERKRREAAAAPPARPGNATEGPRENANGEEERKWQAKQTLTYDPPQENSSSVGTFAGTSVTQLPGFVGASGDVMNSGGASVFLVEIDVYNRFMAVTAANGEQGEKLTLQEDQAHQDSETQKQRSNKAEKSTWSISAATKAATPNEPWKLGKTKGSRPGQHRVAVWFPEAHQRVMRRLDPLPADVGKSTAQWWSKAEAAVEQEPLSPGRLENRGSWDGIDTEHVNLLVTLRGGARAGARIKDFTVSTELRSTEEVVREYSPRGC